jgi:NADP-dependent 3-hydroxy acid dehydrogenase YdfG
MSVWFVTGSSRGFGAEIVSAALAEGHQVGGTARRADAVTRQIPDAGEALLAVDLDVTDPGRIRAAVTTAVDHFGRIDILVNNAGHGILTARRGGGGHRGPGLLPLNLAGALPFRAVG